MINIRLPFSHMVSSGFSSINLKYIIFIDFIWISIARNDRDDHSNLTAYQWNSNSILPPINPLYGMQFLSRIEQLEIEQIVDLSTCKYNFLRE